MTWVTVSLLTLSSVFAADGPGPTTPLHPPVVLRDREGEPVIRSGEPISPTTSCGTCHDTDFIHRHSYHAAMGIDERVAVGAVPGGRPWDYGRGGVGRWNPLTYRYLTPPGAPQLDLGVADWIRRQGWRHVGGGPALRGFGREPLDRRTDVESANGVDSDRQVLDPETDQPRPWDWQQSGVVEMNCFLCHVDQPDNAARIEQLEAGRFAWADTATLAQTGIVQRQGDAWSYQPDAFGEDGSVEANSLSLRKPTATHCGQCHGLAHAGEEPLELELTLRQWSTATKGQVFSAQRISDSAVNLLDKAEQTRPWDVHAAAMLDCKSCHFSINNPAKFESSPRSRPAHLRFEPRRLSLAEYLRQPSHQFAKGQTAQGTIAEHLASTMRRCEDCHDAPGTHNWLPYQAVHFQRLSCEACHIPQTFAPAVGQVDWTLLDADGQPSIQWRGWKQETEGESLVSGFRPILLPRKDLDGETRLFPFNLISAWYWVAGVDRPLPVGESDLRRALLRDGDFRPKLVAALDGDGDGRLGESELRLDLPEKVAAVRGLLVGIGLVNPRIVGELEPYGLHHGVGPGRDAIRDCEACHSQSSRLTEPLPLAEYLPGGVTPRPVGLADVVFAGSVAENATDAVSWQPELRDAGFYVLGHNRWPWVTALGLFGVLGALMGSAIHAGMRLRHGRWWLGHGSGRENRK